MVRTLKYKVKHSVLLLLIILPLLIGFNVYSNSTKFVLTDHTLAATEERIIGLEQFNSTSLDAQIQIIVNRSVFVNDWAYLTITDTISIRNSSSTFNTFDYSLTNEFYDLVEYVEVRILEGADEQVLTPDVVTDATTGITTLTTTIPEVPVNETSEYKFQVLLGVSDALTKTGDPKPADQADADTNGYPFRVSGVNFFPWLNFPITTLEVKMGIDSKVIEQNTDLFFSNTSILPNPDDINAEFNLDDTNNQNIGIYVVNSVSGITSAELDAIYPNRGTRDIIPEFQSETEDALTEALQFDFSFANAPIEYTKAEITIDINQWGIVTYTEVITILHRGVEGQFVGGPSNSDGTMLIYINSPELETVSVFDVHSNLTAISTQSLTGAVSPHAENITLVNLPVRIPLSADSMYSFKFSYQISHKHRLKEISGFLLPEGNITTPAMSIFNWTVRDVSIQIIFPLFADNIRLPNSFWGLSISDPNITFTSTPGLLTIPRPTVKIELSEFSFYNNKAITITYSLTPVIGLFWEPIIFVLLFLLFGLFIIAIRSISYSISRGISPTTQTVSKIPFDLIRGFVINYEEKTALRTRLTNLKKKRGNMRNVDYQKQRQTLLNKQAEVERDIVKISNQFANQGARYRDAIRSIELAEAELEQSLGNLRDIELKKKQKRISTDIYNRLRDEDGRRLRRANASIERVLVDLRSLLTERR